jgi:serine/threonine protein kinase
LKEAEAIQICKGLAKALMFMHGKNICHRDLKMDNIIIADRNGQPKIIDFGFSIESGD